MMKTSMPYYHHYNLWVAHGFMTGVSTTSPSKYDWVTSNLTINNQVGSLSHSTEEDQVPVLCC